MRFNVNSRFPVVQNNVPDMKPGAVRQLPLTQRKRLLNNFSGQGTLPVPQQLPLTTPIPSLRRDRPKRLRDLQQPYLNQMMIQNDPKLKPVGAFTNMFNRNYF